MKRFFVLSLLVILVGGCKTVIEISTRGEPEAFDPIALVTQETYYYREIEVTVPEEIQDEEWEVTRVDVFGQITAQYLDHPVDVELYVGRRPGDGDLSDPDQNVRIASRRITQDGEVHRIEVKSPPLVLEAMKQEELYVKAVVRSSVPTVGLVRVHDLYLDIRLERDSSGLFPFFYLF